MQLTEYEQNILSRLTQLIHQVKLSNNFMVQNIELIFEYTGLRPVQKIALEDNIIYNGVLKYPNYDKYNFF